MFEAGNISLSPEKSVSYKKNECTSSQKSKRFYSLVQKSESEAFCFLFWFSMK